MDYLDAADSLTSFENSPRNTITAVIATTACLLTLYIYLDSRNKHQYWSKRGVKGPKPIPVFGNVIDHVTGNRLKKELEWVKKFGKVYGTYEGTKPQLFVADPEMLLQCCVKDFEVFPNHLRHDVISKYLNSALVFQQDDRWRMMRVLLTPTFTVSKIRRMFRFLDYCVDDLVESFEKAMINGKKNAGIDVKELYACFTLDAVATFCYGHRLDRLPDELGGKSPRDRYIEDGKKMIKINWLRTFLFALTPNPILRLMDAKTIPDSNFEPITKRLQKLIDQRRQSGAGKFDDYLQMLVDARLDDQVESDEMDSAEEHHAAETVEDRKQLLGAIGKQHDLRVKLTDLEILGNLAFITVTGLSSVSATLAHCTYALAFHPEIQERLYEEVKRIAKFDSAQKRFSLDYESITSCHYLDACLSEGLRMNPPILHLERVSSCDYLLKKYNLTLPKGSVVQFAYYAMMNDPDYWVEPERYNPDRFMPGEREKIVPGSYCPFGIGPRYCFGMRFSLTEAKLALAKLVLNYRFLPAPGTKFPADPKTMIYLHEIKTPYVTVTSRFNEEQ